LNIVTERSGYPAAVLIRGVEPIVGITGRTDGPGRLCRELGIDRSYNGIDMTAPPLFLTEPSELADWEIESGPRVGVVYAGEWAMRPWRFWIRNNPHVSRPPRRSIGLGEASGVAS
jgi:DNA-3-methyladenine glycosylase